MSRAYVEVIGEGGLVKLGDLLDAIDALRGEGPLQLAERFNRVEVSVNTSEGVTLHNLAALRIRIPITIGAMS